VLVSFELRKFGFTICAAKGAKADLTRLCGQLRVAVKHVERYLMKLAKEQISAGNVTIANRHAEFDRRYRFFRQLADNSYRRAQHSPRKKKEMEPKGIEDMASEWMSDWSHEVRWNTRGFYYSTAMVEAFFSRFEH
jgi:hypothetical protein